jgi:hypothetical protein
MPPLFHRGSARNATDHLARATPASSLAAGILALALALLASGYEVYLRRAGASAPADPAVARRIQALERIRAFVQGPGRQACACLPFNRQTEARLILDDLVARAGQLNEGDFAALEGARRAFDDPARGRDPGQRSEDALAFLAECRKVSERR